MAISPVQYSMKKSSKNQIGFVAQEVREVIPEIVFGEEGDLERRETLCMSCGHLTAVPVNGMQEQQHMIEALTERNKEPGERLAQLEESFCRLVKDQK